MAPPGSASAWMMVQEAPRARTQSSTRRACATSAPSCPAAKRYCNLCALPWFGKSWQEGRCEQAFEPAHGRSVDMDLWQKMHISANFI